MKRKLFILLCIFALVGMPVASKSRGRSSSRSFSSSKSSWGSKSSTTPKTTNKSTSTWGSKQSKTDVGTKVTNTKNTTSTSKVYNTNTKTGQTFKTKADATKAFKTKNAQKYTSKYKTEPTTRPSHIPNTYSTGGSTYNINYNSRYGGYGYFDALGTWIMYDMMMDSVMLDRQMAMAGYNYGGHMMATPVPVRTGFNFVGVLFGLLICALLLLAIIYLVRHVIW